MGIESPDETDGLQHVFDTAYDFHAAPLQNRAAIRFPTGYSPTTGGVAGRVALVPAPDYVDALVIVGSRHIRTNGRGEFLLRGIPAGVHSLTITSSGYETGTVANVTIFPDSVVGGIESVLYRLDPATGLVAELRDNGLVILRWTSPFPASGPLCCPPSAAAKKTAAAVSITHENMVKRPDRVSKDPAFREPAPRGSHSSLDELEGFNVFRNGELLLEMVTDSHFTDTLHNSGEYDYWLTARYTGGASDTSNHARISYVSSVSLEPPDGLPAKFQLLQNWPNPFNSATQICFSLPCAVHVKLDVFNLLGQTEDVPLVDAFFPAGMHRVIWDAKDSRGHVMASGLYIYRLQAGRFTQSRKMILLR